MMDLKSALASYRIILTARLLDRNELASVTRGEAYFHAGSTGHEGNMVLNHFLKSQDWLNCHYRDKALLLARGIPSQEFFNILYGNAESSSTGRQMTPMVSCKAKNVMSMVVPVGNGALQSVGVAAAIKNNSDQPIVVCSLGDGSSQQGEVLEAIAEAVRSELPVLFFVQDNALAISTRTQYKTFFSLPQGEPETFYGLPIHRIDGRNVLTAHDELAPIVNDMRQSRQPAIVVFKVERISSHSNADDQSAYRSTEEINQSLDSGDPLRQLENNLLDNGMSDEQLLQIKQEVESHLVDAENAAKKVTQPVTTTQTIYPVNNALESQYQLQNTETNLSPTTMREALNGVLDFHLANNDSVFLYGQDIEDPKGDVFGVTRGLSSKYTGRVVNAPLSESTIIGSGIGRALTGQKPVCFIQFADFLPHAANQILSELATLYWRSNGDWNAPVIVMVACSAYRPGLGPFHAQSYEAMMAHTPGLDVFLPSNAADAAGMLNSAFLSDRPSIFFYPKSLLNQSNNLAPHNLHEHFYKIGAANLRESGNDLTLIGWGNTVSLCSEVAGELKAANKTCDVIDLACLSPWDSKTVLESANKTGKVIVVQEDNHTAGFAAEVVATIAEKYPQSVTVKRITRPDTYLPFNFTNQQALLPSFESILTAATKLLNLSLSWHTENNNDASQAIVTAIGSGPSDETVEIIDIPVQVGDVVARGDVVMVVEAAKSIVDMTSSYAGVVADIKVAVEDIVKVGAPVLAITLDDQEQARDTNNLTERKPIIKALPNAADLSTSDLSTSINTTPQKSKIGIYQIASATGSRQVKNEDIIQLLADDKHHTSEEIEKLTGITSRNWIADNESALTLATQAVKQLLANSKIDLSQIDLIVCSTTSPTKVSPSLACQVLAELSNGADHEIQAYDIFAACSGYLYALQAAYDYISAKPNANVLVITAEVLSPLLNSKDFDTYILFADAATATLVCGNQFFENALCELNRPVLSAKKDKKGSLLVPIQGHGHIEMEGRIVFSEAVRAMQKSLVAACEQQSISIDDIHLAVPHQASQRIMNAVGDRINAEVFTNVKEIGNTSSSSIPLGLQTAINQCKPGDKIGLCAFGAGFTYGASVLEKN